MDLLVRLYALPEAPALPMALTVRKPIGPEHALVARWVRSNFGPCWSSEARVALGNRPLTLFVARFNTELVGFACYDATARGYVGPIGVADSARDRGIGTALLLACLQDMRSAGYGYAIAGDVGAPDFFRRVAGAIEIPDSTPGIYAGMLR